MGLEHAVANALDTEPQEERVSCCLRRCQSVCPVCLILGWGNPVAPSHLQEALTLMTSAQ